MKADHLIKAHQILADWQKNDPDADRKNAYSLVLLSVAPKLTTAELCERKVMLKAIGNRQEDRLATAIAAFIDRGGNLVELKSLLSIAADLYSTLSLTALMDQFGMPPLPASSTLP